LQHATEIGDKRLEKRDFCIQYSFSMPKVGRSSWISLVLWTLRKF